MALRDPIPSRHRLITVLMRGRRLRLAGLGVLLLISSALPLAGPQLLRSFIDHALLGRPQSLLVLIAAAFLAVSFANQLLTVSVAHASAQLAWAATNSLRDEVAGHAVALDLSFHDERSPGEMIERVDGDITALSSFVTSFVVQVAGSTLTLLGVLVVVFFEDWRIGLGMAGFVAVSALIIARLRNFAVPRATERRAASARLFGEIEERLHGAEDLRANGGGAYGLRRFQTVLASLIRVSWRASVATRTVYAVTVMFFAAGEVLSLVGGTMLFQAEAISLGTVYLLYRYTSLLRDPLEQIADQQQIAQDAIAGFARIEQLLDTHPSIRDIGHSAVPAGPLDVDLDGVSFAYPNGAEILRGIDVRLRAGAVVGIVGRTGSGKTTTGRLLVRLLDPTGGSARVGGVDVRDIALADLRRRVALVTQDVQLFEASVRDNVTLFGTYPADDDRLLGVLADLGLEPWFRALPDGLDTVLGPDGVGVSAGEAQLIAFARVFLRDPGVVILDEATSRLDPSSEQRIERAIDKLLAGRTAILIAHRLSTLDRADEIVVLDRGRIAEHGRRTDLARDPRSRFAGLLATASEGALR